MGRMYAVSICLPVSEEMDSYLSEYLPFYCGVQRDVFQALKHGVLDNTKRSKYVSDVMNQHGVLKRTVNSIVNDMQGRIKAYLELKNTELQEVSGKLDVVEDKIEDQQQIVNEMKPKAAANSLTEDRKVWIGTSMLNIAVRYLKEQEWYCFYFYCLHHDTAYLSDT